MRELFGVDAGADGFPHRLDVRVKMAIAAASSIAVIFFDTPQALSLLLCGSMLYALSLKRPFLLGVVYLMIALMWAVAFGFMHLMHHYWPMGPPPSPARMLAPFLRVGVMANVIVALALSTRVQDILSTLKSLRLPFVIYIPSAIMIRFIPTFIADVKQVMETIRTRGHAVTPWGLYARPALAVRLLFAPMLFRSLRASDELGVAAELKGMGRDRRIKPYRVHAFSRRDFATLAIAAAWYGAAAAAQIVHNVEHGAMM